MKERQLLSRFPHFQLQLLMNAESSWIKNTIPLKREPQRRCRSSVKCNFPFKSLQVLDRLELTLARSTVQFHSLLPVDHIPDVIKIFWTAILMLEIVGMFPHINADDRFTFIFRNIHHGVVLVRGSND